VAEKGKSCDRLELPGFRLSTKFKAACEKLISVFEALFQVTRMSALPDLVNAQLRIRCEQILGKLFQETEIAIPDPQ
jgi:hypothetical protein